MTFRIPRVMWFHTRRLAAEMETTVSTADVAARETSLPLGVHLEPQPGSHPRGRRDRIKHGLIGFFWQIVVMGGLFALYRFGRYFSADQAAIAFSHAEELWNIERWFRLPNEAWLQDITMNTVWFIKAANSYYYGAHFTVTIAVFVWLYISHRDQYRWARAVIIMSSLTAMVIQIGIPVAPPRMLTQYGLLDTMAMYGPNTYPPNQSGISNQFAALPSLHVAWAVLVAAMAWRMRHNIARVVLTIHAVLTAFVVLVTANHYWIDGIFGIALVAGAWLIRSTDWAEGISKRWRLGSSARPVLVK
jgi:hypothetical protein